MAGRFDVAEALVEQARDRACGWYGVRWAVEGRERCRSFVTTAPADVFLGDLKAGRRNRVAVPVGCCPAALLTGSSGKPPISLRLPARCCSVASPAQARSSRSSSGEIRWPSPR